MPLCLNVLSSSAQEIKVFSFLNYFAHLLSVRSVHCWQQHPSVNGQVLLPRSAVIVIYAKIKYFFLQYFLSLVFAFNMYSKNICCCHLQAGHSHPLQFRGVTVSEKYNFTGCNVQDHFNTLNSSCKSKQILTVSVRCLVQINLFI